MSEAEKIKRALRRRGNKDRAQHSQSFFKTGKGDYGEGDVFIGVTVPDVRVVAKKFGSANLKTIESLLYSRVHEDRLCAVLILVDQYRRGNERQKRDIYNFYLKKTDRINNWDLVDLSAHKIVGEYLLNRDRKILCMLAASKNLWCRRIAVISTFAFIRNGDLKDALMLSKILLKDKHDLIHKAVGWVLREVGKKSSQSLYDFLDAHVKCMPRTMLRYSIEKMPEQTRLKYLKS